MGGAKHFLLWATALVTACNQKGTGDGTTPQSEPSTASSPAAETTDASTGKVAIVGSLAGGFDDKSVDSVRAFPVSHTGADSTNITNSVSSPVVAGSVAVEIPQDAAASLQGSDGRGTSGDWVVALVDSSKTEKIEQIVGFLGLDSTGDSMMKLPIKNTKSSRLDFGDITLSGTDAVSSTKLDDEAKNFDLEVTALREIANTDNLIQGLKNTYANTSADGSVYYSIQPFFIYKGDAGKANNKFSEPTDIKYAPTAGGNNDFGYGFYFKVNDPDTASFDNICATDDEPKHKTLKFVPPSDLLKNSVTYNASNPLTNNGLTKTGNGTVTCSYGEFYMSGAPGQRDYSFNFGGGGYKGAILPGLWKLYISDKQVAAFDLAAYSPVNAAGKPLVYVPALKLTVNSENKIDKVEVKFFFLDKATSAYVEVTDLALFQNAVANLTLTLSDSSGINAGCSGDSITEMTSLTAPSGNIFEFSSFGSGKWRAPGDLSTTEKVATGITIDYKVAGVSVSFVFEPDFNGCN